MIDRITEQPFCQTRVSGSTFVNADCFDVFPFIEDKSIDAIICDLPYGTTACKWDTIIPFDKLWEQYERIIKPNGAIVLFGQEPFSSYLRVSNISSYRYDWIWKKNSGSNFLFANKQPMKMNEIISVFYKKQPIYNPQKTDAVNGYYTNKNSINKGKDNSMQTGNFKELTGIQLKKTNYGKNYEPDKKLPENIIEFKRVRKPIHPTQKPVELMEYLIKTYTNEGETVLDNCMGSGTTNLACIKLNRKSIGIEKEKQYYDVAVRRAYEYCH